MLFLFWLFLIKTVKCQILRFLVFRIHNDIENKDNMKNRILLHMPEHSQDISIHCKPFLKIHDIEARLNPINKLNLIVLTLYYLLYSNIFIYIYNKSICKTSIKMIFFIKSIDAQCANTIS